jgi:hypothetical protein
MFERLCEKLGGLTRRSAMLMPGFRSHSKTIPIAGGLPVWEG